MSHFKVNLFLISLLIVSTVNAQEPGEIDSLSGIDSIERALKNQLNNQIERIQSRFDRDLQLLRGGMDSMRLQIKAQQAEIDLLNKEKDKFSGELKEAEKRIMQNQRELISEREKNKRILFIAGPSILILILVSVILFFLTIMKQQDETERKINSLRKYAHSEIEESTTDLMKKLKKKLKSVQLTVNASGSSTLKKAKGGKKRQKKGKLKPDKSQG